MIPFSSKVSSQIRFLLQSLNDSNSDSVCQELCKCTTLGLEGSILLLQTCLDHLNIYGNDLKNMKLHPIYASIFKHILDKPNFCSVLSESLKTAPINEELLQNLSGALHLSVSEKIGIGLALSNSGNHDIRVCGKNFCMTQIADLCANPVPFESTAKIQHIIMFLSRSEGLSKHVDSFMQMLSLVQWKDGAEFILAPFLPDELHSDNFFRHLDMLNEGGDDDFDAILAEMEKEISMADVMSELGYGCTVNVSQCKEILSLFLPLSDATIAKILGTVARTYAGLDDSQNVLAAFRSSLGGNSVLDQPSLDSWNVEVLVESIKQLAPGINWINVVEKLDHEGFYIPDETAFSFFMSVYRHACQDPFPLHAVCGFVWKNVEGQLSFLKYAVSVPPEVFTFAHSERQLSYDDALTEHTFQPGQVNHAWLCHDLLDVLCQLSERGHASLVRSVLEKPLNHCPRLLLLGMAHVNTAYNLIQNEVASTVLPMALRDASGNRLIFNLWHVNPNMLLRGLIDAMSLHPENVYRILDACHELEILSPVLDMIPFYFGIRLAALAFKKEIMGLENWLSTHLVTYKDAFYEECLKFLKDVQIGSHDVSGNRFHPPGALLNIYLEAYPTVLKVLQSHAGVISSSNLSEEIEKLDVSHMLGKTRVKNGAGSDSTTSDSYADDIETESNQIFHQMFSGHRPVDDMIQMLTRFKESSDKREQSIYECMVANLFEEFKFFTKYPDRQLRIASILFGSLIKHQLVTHLTLGIALRAVLDSLRKPTDSKMFSFGTKALEQFVDRLIEWPQYCNHILQISHLRGTHPELVAFVERTLKRISAAHHEPDVVHNVTSDHHHGLIQPSAMNVEIPGSSFSLIGPGTTQMGLQVSSPIQLPQRPLGSLDERKTSAVLSNYVRPAQSSSGQPAIAPSSDTSSIQKSHSGIGVPSVHSASPGFPRSSRATSARFGSALNIETLVAAAERRETPIEAPPSEIQDKTSFIINNLSAANIEAKAKEFTEIFTEQYYPWFAQYMVMKRASIETNFHDLYLKFLDKVNLKPLNKEIVQATYENCKVLLGSELIKSSVEERSLLKNLGSWLGKITIGKNQVLRAREIDPKSLIIEAYEKGLMIAVIPFTSKILEPCSNSLAYQPPNPWTMGILGLLAEIYAMPNLKMNLKFEIEVLFKNLGVDLKDVTPTSLLKDKGREVDGNPDFSNKDVGPSQPPIISEPKSGIISMPNQVEVPLDVAAPAHPGGHSRILSQYGTALHSSGTLMEDEKLVSLGFSDQLPSAQGLLQGPTPFSANQLPVPAANIEQQVVVNKKLQAYGLHMHFQSILPISMDRAVKEIVSSIVQRSVSIATQTTNQLVLKDYEAEPDETLIRNAAHLMVARLAGSLAHVTCKEPLRGSISGQLRSALQGLSISTELLEQAVQLVTNDNLDLGCVLIEQAATEKAVQTIDGEIAQQLSMRKHRESVGPAFFDASLYAQGQVGVLPEALRPRPGHLSHSQQRVYEDFARFPGQNRSSQSSNSVPVGPSATAGSGGLSRQFASATASGQISEELGFGCASDCGLNFEEIKATKKMLDLNLFRIERGNDPEAIRISQRRRGESVEIVDEIIQLDINWRKRQYELDMLRKDLRSLTTKVASLKIDKKIDKSDSDDGVKEAEAEAREKMKNSIAKKEMEVNEAWDELYKKLIQVGNLVDSSVTVGFDEAKNPIVRTWGEPRQMEPKLKNHVELVKLLGIVDTVNGSKVAGHRGYYMIGVGVRLILALVQQGISFLNSKGYSEVMTPYFMNQDVMANCAQLLDFDDELYKVSGEKDDEKYLIATAEQPLCALHCKSWMKHSELPKRYAGFSSCFRKEAGSHGKDTLGIFRTHQFEKVEQFCITDPNHSWEMLEEMMKNSEEFYQMLGLPYRTVAIVSGALNAAAAKKYDLEAWFPASGTFRELVSCSNCTDYQSRKLEIRYNGPKKGSDSTKQYVHMLNCTLIAAQRTLCCILENYQKEDGVEIPELLRPMLGGMTFLPFKS